MGRDRDRPDRPESIQIPRKFVDATSNIRDTMVRYDLERMRAKPEALSVELAGASDECDQRFPIRVGKTTIGRGEGCDIHIEAGHVSRLHATLELADGALRILDEGSSNGTYVNGHRVNETTLADGDIVHLGPILRFVVVIRRPEAMTGPPDPTTKTMPPPASVSAPSPDPAVNDSLGETPPLRASVSTVDLLERERRQLALLLQIAMRYLGASAEDDPVEVLFAILPAVVEFDAAFVATDQEGTLAFYAHPQGTQLEHADYAKLVKETSGGPVVRDSAVDGIVLSGMKVASRVLLPLPNGGCLGLLAVDTDRYSHQLEFLVILSQIHARAATRRP